MKKEVTDLEDLDMSGVLWRIIAFSSGGPFLEGYVLGIIGVALSRLGTDIEISNSMSGLLGIAALVGLFLGAAVGGWLTDLIGRHKMFILDLIVIVVLSALCAVVTSPLQLVALRFLIGVAIGADYPIATSMIAEFSPRKHRAMSMGMIAAAWSLGANVAALVGYALYETPHGWRWMLASSAIPAVLILIGRWDIPESPRWLASKGRQEEADRVVMKLFGENVRLPAQEIAEKTEFKKIFSGVYLRRVIFVGVIWLCQAIPMFALYTYGPTIVGSIGLGEGRNSLIGELVIGTFFMIGTFPAMYLAERVGRHDDCTWPDWFLPAGGNRSNFRLLHRLRTSCWRSGQSRVALSQRALPNLNSRLGNGRCYGSEPNWHRLLNVRPSGIYRRLRDLCDHACRCPHFSSWIWCFLRLGPRNQGPELGRYRISGLQGALNDVSH